MKERTLILVKHDGVLKNLVGEVIRRFENIGLKIVGMKMIWPDDELLDQHYPVTDEWAKGVFDKTKSAHEKQGKEFKFNNYMEYGKKIQSFLKESLSSGPVVALVFEGPHSVEIGRKLVGATEPRQALPGTIRGDYSFDSYSLADPRGRSVRNLVHASDTVENAKREISIWFKEDELHDYEHHAHNKAID